jgi:hypothetical protein
VLPRTNDKAGVSSKRLFLSCATNPNLSSGWAHSLDGEIDRSVDAWATMDYAMVVHAILSKIDLFNS